MALKCLSMPLSLSPSLVVDSVVLAICVKNNSHELVERPVEERLGSFGNNMYSIVIDNNTRKFRLQDDKLKVQRRVSHRLMETND